MIFRASRSFLVRFALVLTVGFVACGGQEPSTAPVRLVDAFADARVIGTPAVETAAYETTEWSFEEGTDGFRVSENVIDFRSENGALRGRSTSERPVLAVLRESDVPDADTLYEVRVRARSSAGTKLTVTFDDANDVARPAPSRFNPLGILDTPIRAGDEMQTYVIRANLPFTAESIGRVLLSPTNAADADFEIQSLRLVFRREHLQSIPSGVGWHGMSEIYREAIVARSPESIRFDVTLPAEPWLDLAVATIEASPVTFRVEVAPEGADGPIERTAVVETPDQWKELSLSLEGLAGKSAQVTLSVEADESGVLGFWGAPAVRSNASLDGHPQGVVLIITDTLRADHLAAYGYERDTAPTLTRLGREGVQFQDVVSQATWTKVSVPAIQTSLYPTTHTITDIPDRLPASATTIAEIYRDAGYRTLALTSIPFVGRLTNLHQGYEELHESTSLENWRTSKPAREYADRLLPWLERYRATPFFVLLHLTDPHAPFRPPPDYETTFAKEGDMDRLDEMIEQVSPHIADQGMRRFGAARRGELEAAGIDPEVFVTHETNGMDGSIRGMDDVIARVVDAIDEHGLTDRVLVGVVADHGTELLEHGEHFHGHTVYGELNRVPMLVWGPSYVQPTPPVEALVQTIDLMPTLLELSSLPVPEGAQGESLLPFIDGERSTWNRPGITEHLAPNVRGRLPMISLIADGWKLIRVDEADGPRYELYSYEDDPLDANDVAADHPEIVDRLAEQIERFRQFASAARLDDAAATEGLDAEELERLRSLGYVQ